MHTSSDFVLHGGDTGFANRQKLLFDQLQIAEKQCSKNKDSVASRLDVDTGTEEPSRSHFTRPGHKPKSETKRYCGKESIFKRPEGPAPRASSRNVPDYHRNPHKWIKYSLDDVSNEDMTDISNTQTALSFLKELRARRLKEEDNKKDQMETDLPESYDKKGGTLFKSRKFKSASQIEFKRPKKVEKEVAGPVVIDPDDKPSFKSSKIIMPEYVVGQKLKRKKHDKPLVKIDRSKQLKLDHLQEPDEEEQD